MKKVDKGSKRVGSSINNWNFPQLFFAHTGHILLLRKCQTSQNQVSVRLKFYLFWIQIHTHFKVEWNSLSVLTHNHTSRTFYYSIWSVKNLFCCDIFLYKLCVRGKWSITWNAHCKMSISTDQDQETRLMLVKSRWAVLLDLWAPSSSAAQSFQRWCCYTLIHLHNQTQINSTSFSLSLLWFTIILNSCAETRTRRG